ncbi:hypothetical protein Bca101_055899 [Brassica carinata]
MDYSPSVFLSFRKEDTGRTFVSHLYRSLDQKRIPTYKDDQNQEARDGRISPEVAKAIRESNVAVVVISENYASSAWCLKVLAEIISRYSYRTSVKAVFYEVDPVDWTGKFADDMRRHERRETPETVTRWRNALERLHRSEPKFCSQNWDDDSKMIDDLIICISSPPFPNYPRHELRHAAATGRASSQLTLMSDTYMKHVPQSLPTSGEAGLESQDDDLSNESPSPADGLVGMYRHKTAVYALLDLESKDTVRTVGIWGEDGVGKTTLAECVFNDISPHFQHHCFLSNVNNIYQNRISPSLLKHLTTKKSSDNIFDAIKPFLVNRHVLLVIDGVHDTNHEQFKDAMKVSRWLGPGSRVIMTSWADYTLINSCGVKYIYHMESLRYEEALQLFSLCAFKMPYPPVGFEGLSIRAVHFAGRLPLALKVLGSLLFDKDEESWKTTLRKLEASQDNGSRQITNYIGAGEYLPRRQIELEQYVRANEEEHSASYHMLL